MSACPYVLCFRLTSSFIRKLTKLHFCATLWYHQRQLSAIAKRFNVKKLISRVLSIKSLVLFVKQRSSVSEPPSGDFIIIINYFYLFKNQRCNNAKLKTWTLNKTHQAQTNSYGGLWKNKNTKTHKYTK